MGPIEAKRLVAAYEKTLRGLGIQDRGDPIAEMVEGFRDWSKRHGRPVPDLRAGNQSSSGHLGRLSWRPLSFRMSPVGTFRTCRGGRLMSVVGEERT